MTQTIQITQQQFTSMQHHFVSLKGYMEQLDHDFAHQDFITTRGTTQVYSETNIQDLIRAL